jgi:GT2 family glycosyltransferase
MHKLKLLLSCLRPLATNPSMLLPSLRVLWQRARSAGLTGVKIGLREIRSGRLPHANSVIWKAHQSRLEREVKPFALQTIASMVHRPLISVLIPTCNTPGDLLERTIESVRGQWYPDWELCICDDASSDGRTLAILKRYGAMDGRIKIACNERNRNIAATTNRALSMASGEYVLLLDHDDLLQPQALFRIAQSAVAQQPDFIYSDEALISKKDADILEFFCRPQFSLEMLRSQPYIVHLICFRRLFLQQIGGLDERLRISQDYDLILRAAEQAEKIAHIPEILYLWRRVRSSAGHRMQSEVIDASTRILQRHLQRCNVAGCVAEAEFFNTFDIRYPLRPGLKVAIVIPTRNDWERVRRCIESIEATVSQAAWEIVIIDHRSDEPASLAYLDTLRPRYQVIPCGRAFNFSAINNRDVAAISGDFSHYLFCNDKIEAIEPGWLERMLELGQQPDVAIVGAKLLYPDRKRIRHAGVGVGLFTAAEYYGKSLEERMPDGRHNRGYQGSLICTHEVSAVTAACMLIRCTLFQQLQGFDERLAVSFGDIDLCLRARAAGYRVLFSPHATLIHHGSCSRGTGTAQLEAAALFRCRWKRYMDEGDPYYNPNLSDQSYSWEIKEPLPVTLQVPVRTGESIRANSC